MTNFVLYICTFVAGSGGTRRPRRTQLTRLAPNAGSADPTDAFRRDGERCRPHPGAHGVVIGAVAAVAGISHDLAAQHRGHARRHAVQKRIEWATAGPAKSTVTRLINRTLVGLLLDLRESLAEVPAAEPDEPVLAVDGVLPVVGGRPEHGMHDVPDGLLLAAENRDEAHQLLDRLRLPVAEQRKPPEILGDAHDVVELRRHHLRLEGALDLRAVDCHRRPELGVEVADDPGDDLVHVDAVDQRQRLDETRGGGFGLGGGIGGGLVLGVLIGFNLALGLTLGACHL